MSGNIGALITRIGFGGIIYYPFVRNPQNNIGNYSSPYSPSAEVRDFELAVLPRSSHPAVHFLSVWEQLCFGHPACGSFNFERYIHRVCIYIYMYTVYIYIYMYNIYIYIYIYI